MNPSATPISATNTRGFVRAALTLVLCLGCAAAGGAVPQTAGPDELLAAARADVAAGATEQALLLYEQVLARDPDNPAALAESAQQLSWQQQYDTALARYDRILELAPGHRQARLERAKVLSWARRFDESIAAFRSLLADEPDALDARIGLARALSWSGRITAARSEYEAILAAHPDNADALLGLAQTEAWSGDLQAARPAYEAAARAAEETRDAEIGLAYLDLWEGATVAAHRNAEALAAQHPDNTDARELLQATRAATAPWAAASWDQLDDSDENLLTATRVESGLSLAQGPVARLAYTDYDVATEDQDGAIRSVQGVTTWQPRPRHNIEAMLGIDRLEGTTEDDHDVTDWGLRWGFPLQGSWTGSLGARQEPYRYSVPLIDDRIVIESVNGGASGRLGEHWRLAAETSAWQLSDDNRRVAADLALRRDWQRTPYRFEAGLSVRWLDWDDDLDNGYFDPADFIAWGIAGRTFGRLPTSAPMDYDISAEAGLQSFETGTESTSNDPYYLLTARLGWQATPGLRLEGWAEAGSYASQGAENWHYTRFGLRLIHRFGLHAQ